MYVHFPALRTSIARRQRSIVCFQGFSTFERGQNGSFLPDLTKTIGIHIWTYGLIQQQGKNKLTLQSLCQPGLYEINFSTKISCIILMTVGVRIRVWQMCWVICIISPSNVHSGNPVIGSFLIQDACQSAFAIGWILSK